jgi:DUF4097 and DUF4098 domain-containing protein YvlB
MIIIRLLTISGIFLAILCSIPACLPEKTSIEKTSIKEETVEYTHKLVDGGTFEIKNCVGAISIASWDKDTIHIKAIKRAPESLFDQLSIETKFTDKTASIKTRAPQATSNSSYSNWKCSSSEGLSVDYTIKVPRKVSLVSVTSINGNITVSNIDSNLRVTATNGNIDINNNKGDFNIRTTNGNIKIEQTSLESNGSLTAATINGCITLCASDTVHALLKAQTTNGSIALTIKTGVEVLERHKKYLIVQLGIKPDMQKRASATISLQTTNGSIDITRC